jgi:phospholipid/cholesterol/gamma-HCH transport system ATP-binding protein
MTTPSSKEDRSSHSDNKNHTNPTVQDSNETMTSKSIPVIEILKLETRFGNNHVHKGIDLEVYKGEIVGIVGGSGSGKTTLLREMIVLQPPTKGKVKLFGTNIYQCDETQVRAVLKRLGVVFQHSALFSGLTLLENIAFPLKEHTDLSEDLINEIALLKIELVGLPEDAAMRYPVELSGGMQKRAALARAIALDPELLFLDEPTAGLDPQSASELDELVMTLKTTLGFTVIMVTHDQDTLWRVTDRVIFLGEGRVIAAGPVAEVANDKHSEVHDYFHGPRGRAE